jgi:acyl-CoA synthetase (AMP-forming)/AMP-acid ligase II
MRRKRNREINVISLSALDLFCCALGGFILLTAMALPYVPNLSPEELREQLQQAKETAKAAQAKQAELEKTVKQLQESLHAERSDVVIAVDTTASMQNEISGIRSEIDGLAQILRKISGDMRIGFIDYKDICENPAIRELPLTRLDDAGMNTIKSFLAGMQASSTCNQTEQEALYTAFERATRSAWEADPANRIILLIGDNPPYENYNGVNEQAALLSGARAFAATGGKVSTRYSTSDQYADPPVADYYRQVAQAGNGATTTRQQGGFSLSLLLSLSK